MLQKFVDTWSQITDLNNDTDIRGTIEGIKKGIAVKGYNVWILASAAIIASIGLDTNSPAVIIGAMLISPLMSPILGIGLSVGINDRDTLMDSLKNFAIAVGASMVMSYIYFLITPFGEVTSEIKARTTPTLLDVGVAFFGGVAGIVAGSRKDKTNAIPGVAIATALMPPLCVAGFGLAKAKWDFFLGASYLFFMNATFISLSTYMIVRFLRFPYVEFVDRESKRKYLRVIVLFVLVVIAPSVYFLFNVLSDFRTSRHVQEFVKENIDSDGYIRHEYTESLTDSCYYLKIWIAGEHVSDDSVAILESRLSDYSLDNTKLKLTQFDVSEQEWADMKDEVRAEVLKAMEVNVKIEEEKDAQLDTVLRELAAIKADSIPFAGISLELKALYPNMIGLSYANMIETDFEHYRDTVPTFFVTWDKKTTDPKRKEGEERLIGFLTQRLELEKVHVKRLASP